MLSKKSIVYLSIWLVIIFICLGNLLFLGLKVNKTNGTLFSLVLAEQTKNEHAELTVSHSDTWEKIVPQNFQFAPYINTRFSATDENGDLICYGTTYDFKLNNIGKDQIKDWQIEIEIPGDLYVNKAWNGSIEFFQNGGAKHDEFLPMPNKFGSIKIDSIQCSDLVFFPLTKGDRIIYHPSLPSNEYPLNVNGTIKPGIIFYSDKTEISFENIRLNYHIKEKITKYQSFWACLWTIIGATFLLCLLVIQTFYKNYYEKMYRRDLEIIKQAIETFAGFIDSKDVSTVNHSRRVAQLARIIAGKLGFNNEEAEKVYYIGLLHDIGKICIPDEILKKPASLNSEEYEIIKEHTTRGAKLLENFTALDHIAEGALYHHEHYDGTGYPKGLKGKNIPLIGRIIAVADTFDAVSNNRCYSRRLADETIRAELLKNKGRQFDPAIVDAFIKCWDEGELKDFLTAATDEEQKNAPAANSAAQEKAKE